jgi:hypothetical protein
MRRVRTIEIAVCILLSLLIIAGGRGASADMGISGPHMGLACGAMNITITESSTFAYRANGTHFSFYVVTVENSERAWKNESFAYIAELSKENVTYASVEHPIDPGVYGFLIFLDEAPGYVTYSYWVNQTETAQDGRAVVEFPWDVVVSVVLTAVAASAVTYAVMSRRR